MCLNVHVQCFILFKHYLQYMQHISQIDDILNLILNFNEHNILSLWPDTVSFCKKPQVTWPHSKNIHLVVNLPIFCYMYM